MGRAGEEQEATTRSGEGGGDGEGQEVEHEIRGGGL
jgi:hypothetical protein